MKGRLLVESAALGFSPLRNDFSVALIVLMCMVGLELLIACANVANLLIARGFTRQKEIADASLAGRVAWTVRSPVPGREPAAPPSAARPGLLIAIALTRGLLAFIPTEGPPLLLTARPDPRILAFTLALTFFTGLVFGLLPALRASRPDPWRTLKDAVGSVAGSGSSLFLRKGLVTAQVALSFLLLFGAGLFVHSLQNLEATTPGSRLDNLITFQLAPAFNGYDEARAQLLYSELLEPRGTAPGIKSAGFSVIPILAGNEWDSSSRWRVIGPGRRGHAGVHERSLSGLLRHHGHSLIAGRTSTARPEGSPKVAIVNRPFADHYFQEALRRQAARTRRRPEDQADDEIVGVVADSLYEGPREGVRRQVFVPR